MLLALITAVSALLRWHSIGSKSIWIDEAVSVALAQASWSNFWREVWSYEGNMVFYYLLLRGWIHLGQSEVAIRSISVLFGVAAIPAIYLLGKRLFDRETGLTGAALLAVHAAHIQFSQEARSYSLLLLLLILSTSFFVLAIETGPRKTRWLAYIFLSAAAVYSHVLAVLILGAQWLSLGSVRLRQIGLKNILGVLGCLAVLVGPMAAFLMVHNKGQIDWIPRPTVRLVAHGFGFLTGGGVILLFLAYSGACALAAAGRRDAHENEPAPPDNFPVRLLSFSVIFPIAFLLAFSFLIQPLFSYRYLGLCVPALVLLAAHGLSCLKQRFVAARWAMPAALILLLGFSLLGVSRYNRDSARSGNDWRSATRYLLERQESGDAVIFYIASGYRPFAYYIHRQTAGEASRSLLTVLFPEAGSDTDVRVPPSPQQIDLLTKNYQRIWMVLHHENVGQPGFIRFMLPRNLRCVEEREFPGKWPNGIKVDLCSHRTLLSKLHAGEHRETADQRNLMRK
ncbi:MAG: hypothetical protein A3F68_08530 [Acidobacteria bacterium RIFCSPLOWO2_12_FULL_54_10]|nr:MAG: hypothetical protein A3F68_08530 [Acidobacteria bacterium RIFCSPLOWO2_12_FULL_54_10]